MIKIQSDCAWSYHANDVQKLRSYLTSNNGCISAALRSLDAEDFFKGLTPHMMIEVVRMAEKAMKEPYWCSDEHLAELTKKMEFEKLVDIHTPKTDG